MLSWGKMFCPIDLINVILIKTHQNWTKIKKQKKICVSSNSRKYGET